MSGVAKKILKQFCRECSFISILRSASSILSCILFRQFVLVRVTIEKVAQLGRWPFDMVQICLLSAVWSPPDPYPELTFIGTHWQTHFCSYISRSATIGKYEVKVVEGIA